MKKVTIKDIAKLTNVSNATISLVLNDKPSRISQAKKDEIKEVAKKLNYMPNLNAQGLVSNKTKTIGLIIPDIENPFFGSLAKAIEGDLVKEKYAVIFVNTDDSYEKDINSISILNNRGVDGFLLVLSDESFDHQEIIIKELNSLTKPFVLVDRIFENVNYNQVAFDNYFGQYEATKHLIELGYNKIGYLAPPKYSFNSKSRLKGYKRALQDHNINIDENLIVHGNYRFNNGYELTEKLVKRGAKAIIANNDISAYGVMKRISELKLNIPRDIAVLGYDDLFFSDMNTVSLTTVKQDTKLLSQNAVKLLIDSLKGESRNKTIILKPKLIIRNSSKH